MSVLASVGIGGGGGGGSFTPGPLLSGIAGNNNDTVLKAPLAGAMIFGNATPLWDRLAVGTAGQALVVSAGLPAWGTVGVAGGGTGFTTYATGDIIYASAANTLSKLAAGSNGQVLTLAAGVPSWATGGSGTVTSVGMTVPSFLSVAGSPVTTSGTLAVTLATQSANLVFAGPTTGAAAAPTFRAIVTADLPVLATSIGGLGAAQGLLATGSILYANSTTTFTTLGPTTDGFFLVLASGIPSWVQQPAVAANRGGTGFTSYTVGDILYADTTSTLAKRGIGSTSQALIVSGGLPTWGTLPVAGGGTGNTTFTAFAVICAGTTSTGGFQNVSGLGTANQVLTSNGAGALPTWQNAAGGTASWTSSGGIFAPNTSVITAGDEISIRAQVANGASAVAARVCNSNALSTAGARILELYSDDATTLRTFVKLDGTIGTLSAFQLYNAITDANPIVQVNGTQISFGAGGASAVDCSLARSSGKLTLTANVANSGTNVAHVLDNTTSLSGTTLIAAFANAGTQKVTIGNDGSIQPVTDNGPSIGAFTSSINTRFNNVVASGTISTQLSTRSAGTFLEGASIGVATVASAACGYCAAFTYTGAANNRGISVITSIQTGGGAGRWYVGTDGNAATSIAWDPASGSQSFLEFDKTTASFRPGTNGGCALGSSSLRWTASYIDQVRFNSATKTANYTVTATDRTIYVDTTSGAITITLTASPTNKQEVLIVKVTTDANAVTISRNGNNINAAAADLTLAGGAVGSYLLVFDSTAKWFTY